MREQAFNAVSTVFGMLHAGALMTADIIKETEISIIDKTGYWENGQAYAMTKADKENYRQKRDEASQARLSRFQERKPLIRI